MHKNAIAARFPHFLDCFLYDTSGRIYGINNTFTWKGIDLVQTTEYQNVQKHTDVEDLVECIMANICKKIS